MELNPPDGQIHVAATHNLALLGASDNPKVLGNGLGIDNKGMVSSYLEFTGKTIK